MASVSADVLAEFQSITGSEEDYARSLLESHAGDLQASLASHFAIQEAQGDAPRSNAAADDAAVAAAAAAEFAEEPIDVDEEPVRAPIPAHVEQLLDEEPARLGNTRDSEIVEPFQEGSSSRAETASDGQSALGALFRAPVELTYDKSFNEAMQFAQSQNRWLLVNIQSPDVFRCQILNRDLWKDEAVQSIIQNHMVFWQRYRDSEDGERFHQFYPFGSVPYVVIIDPRSGERLLELTDGTTDLGKDRFITVIFDFLSANVLDDYTGASGRQSREAAPSRNAGGMPSQVEADEELAKAIAASMDTSGSGATSSRILSRLQSENNPDLQRRRSELTEQDREYEMALAMDRAREESLRMEREKQQREEEEKRQKELEAEERKKQKLLELPAEPTSGAANATSLVVRMPDGSRLSRRFDVLNTVQDVMNWVESHAEAGLPTYELMTQFPRKTFTDTSQSLKDAGLTPNASLIVHEPFAN